MSIFNAAIGFVFDLFFGATGMLGGEVALWIFSALAGVVFLLIFRATSNQNAIRRTKDRIAAGFLEVRLFKADMGQMMRAQGSIFGSSFRYMAHALVPMLWMVLPVVLMLIQLNLWYGYQPLEAGESALVVARVADPEAIYDLQLEAGEGLEVETPPLRIATLNEVNWRIRADGPGQRELTLSVGDRPITHSVLVEGGFAKIEPVRVRGVWSELWNPGAPPLPSDGPVEHFEVVYPEGEVSLLGWRIHWVIVFLILSIVFGFALKGVLGVEI